MVAERKEREAAQQLGEFQQLVAAERDQLEQLQTYRQQYLSDYGRSQTHLDTVQMERLSGFIYRLGGVIDEQQAKLVNLQKQLDILRQHWQLRHHQRGAIADLVERLARAEDAEAERQLQKLIDDMSNNRLR